MIWVFSSSMSVSSMFEMPKIMPQEGKRSVGYKSFIICDDPRGVVECRTVRKHKNLHSVGRADARSPTTSHLLEVSKGSHKLNHVVSSWSCGGHTTTTTNNNNKNERDMPKDLLKGAIDLGDSLSILSRLQHNKRTQRGGFDDGDLEIKDTGSLARVNKNGVDGKNVYSDPSSEEACCDDRRLDSSDAPSTSSSQSSIVHSSNFVSPESLLSSTASKKKSKKPKGFNLIAKMMGLEDASLRSLPYNGRKHKGGGEKIVNQKKPAFDLDLPSPRAREHDHHDPWKSSWKMRTLDEMIEALKFKGNPKSSGVHSPISSHHSESSNSKHRPPIVIMKPSRFSCLNSDHPIIPKPRAEVDQEMLLKMRIRTNPLAETDGFDTLSYNGKEMLVRAQKLSGNRTYRRKGERKRTSKSGSNLQSLDGDELIDSKLKSSRDVNDTKIGMLQSATTDSGRQGTMSFSNLKNDVPFIHGNQRYKDEGKEVDSICGRECLLPLEESTGLAEDASQIEIITDYVDGEQSSASETPSSSNNRINTQTALICPNERGTIDRDKESQCSISDIMPVEEGSSCSESSRATIHVEEEENSVRMASASSIDDHSSSRNSSSIGGNKLKALLLRSTPFINRAEELFGLKGNPEQDLLQEIGNDLNARMLLDCANELVDHGSEWSTVWLPVPSTHKMSCVTSYYTSLEQLVDEVCNGIEALGCYVKDEIGDVHSTDSLLLLVKGDLRSGKMVTGVWDIGWWTNAGSADEIEEITTRVDELVLDALIEEILVDLAL